MPEVKNAVWLAAVEAGTEDDIGFVLQKRFEDLRVFSGIVFEVGVLNDDEVAGGFLNAAAQGSSFAHVMGLEKDAYLRVVVSEGGKNVARAIA